MSLLVGCGDTVAPPELTFSADYLRSDGYLVVLTEITFPDYETAIASGPVEMVIDDGAASAVLYKQPGYCRELAACAGPLTQEQIRITFSPSYPDNVNLVYCVGLDGSLTDGIDKTLTGSCRD